MSVPLPRLFTVGQLTSDVLVVLDGALPVGDQVTGAAHRTLGGSAAIAAHNAAVLGLAPVVFAGHVGADATGAGGLGTLRAAGVQIGSLLQTAASPEVLVLVEPSGARTMVAAPGKPDWSALRFDHDLRPGDTVLFEGWHLFAPGPFGTLVAAARRAGATVAIDVCSASRAVDPAAHLERLRHLAPDILFANDTEATVLGLEPGAPGVLTVVHAGAHPTRIWRGARCSHVDVPRRVVHDTTGAGDTFAGAFLAAQLAGRDVVGAAVVGHAAAGAVVERHGALLPSLPAPELGEAPCTSPMLTL